MTTIYKFSFEPMENKDNFDVEDINLFIECLSNHTLNSIYETYSVKEINGDLIKKILKSFLDEDSYGWDDDGELETLYYIADDLVEKHPDFTLRGERIIPDGSEHYKYYRHYDTYNYYDDKGMHFF